MNEALISHDGPGHQWLAGLGARGMALGLPRVRALLDALDRPERAFLVVAVAGTDGKGSTAAMIDALLRAGGVHSALYTSPHLVETRERLAIRGTCVPAEDLDAALVRTRDAACQAVPPIEPTPFEALTAAALWLCRAAGVQVAVLEVGLGGRLDAVNATEPAVSVVTQLSYDHTAVLGNLLADIAWEKCGIARAGRPLVVAQAGLCRAALKRHGVEPSQLRSLGPDAAVDGVTVRGAQWRTAGRLQGRSLPTPIDLDLDLPGRHQLDNAALALLAVQALGAAWAATGARPLPGLDELAPALTDVAWPARIEVSEVDEVPLVLDAAHNPAGLAALADALAEHGAGWQVLLAVRTDRDPGDVIRAIAKVAQSLWFVRCDGSTLRPPEDLADAADAAAPHLPYAVGGLRKCLDQARREAGKRGGVVVTGSQHALGEWLQSGAIGSRRLDRRLGRT
ncbi:MAG: bifunctional folylpolyglutamate synthase/dihydrofolate synthase [Myxococcales bacterium]|nr:bifunctional folylpolyglutamate synthase/dihydrofolate synthase [Myxococcales bacterium]